MIIKEIEFIGSFPKEELMPSDIIPEFVFIGRSNVGKSSLINMLCNHDKLAKVSSTPGKTQLINVFMLNNRLKIIDLPGYGYAKVSQQLRKSWGQMIEYYLKNRSNITCVFILIDSRLDPQKIDIEFITWCAEHNLPLALIYTKSDKSKLNIINRNIQKMRNALLPVFQTFPDTLLTSAEKKSGKEEVWRYIEKVLIAYEQYIHENKIK